MKLTKQIACSTVGFALYLSINAISIWGGFFPLFPAEFQTPEILMAFFVAQALSFCGVFLAGVCAALRVPTLIGRIRSGFFPSIIFLGSICLISAMYLKADAFLLVITGGVLLGGGCAGLFAMWQRVFAAMPLEQGNLTIILGSIAAPFIYSAVTLAPEAIAAFLVPAFLAPLCATCLSIASHETDFNQPMFEDRPAEHPEVYGQTAHDHWRGILCLGVLGFASGIVRGIAVLDDQIVHVINEASLVGLFVSAAIMLAFCCMKSIRIDLTGAFRIIYPLLIGGFLLAPFAGALYLTGFVTLAYFSFSVMQMLMMMQSAQISRNRGVHPVFSFGLFAGAAYFLQSIGFAVGWFGSIAPTSMMISLLTISLVSVCALSMALFIVVWSSLKDTMMRNSISNDPIELLLRTDDTPILKEIGERAQAAAALMAPSLLSPAEEPQENETKTRRTRPSSSQDANVVRDMISKRCRAVAERYSLSIRELEIAELIVRGYTVPAIAGHLVISEHTVKTHAKHIYAKLDVHKKQELLELVDSIEIR